LTGSNCRRLNEQALDIAVWLALLAAAAGYLIRCSASQGGRSIRCPRG